MSWNRATVQTEKHLGKCASSAAMLQPRATTTTCSGRAALSFTRNLSKQCCGPEERGVFKLTLDFGIGALACFVFIGRRPVNIDNYMHADMPSLYSL